MAASSGAQTAGRVSSGSSTTLRCWVSSCAEAVGEEVVLFGGGLRELVGGGLVADGEIDLDVAGARRDGADKAAGDDGAGEAGLVPVEVELVAGLAVGEGDRAWTRLCCRWRRPACPAGRGCGFRR